MEHLENVSKRIIACLKDATHPVQGTSTNISGFAVEFARLCKNIKETSFSESDRLHRCAKLAEDSGVDSFYIKELTS